MAKGILLPCASVKDVEPGDPTDACAFILATEKKRMSICNSMPSCEYIAVKRSITDTIDWAKDHDAHFIPFDADEEGNFELSAPPGIYLALMVGQAGSNQCVWQEPVTVGKTVQTTVAKLSSPFVAD